jgi:hypothetical protein
LPDGRVLTFSDATTGVVQALYSEALWPTLAKALQDLADGTGITIMALADAYLGRDDTGHYSTTLDGLTAVRCLDSPRLPPDPERDRQDAERIAQAAPFLDSGDPAVAVQDACTSWPAEPTLPEVDIEAGSLPPVLVISTTGDPATPYEAGGRLAEQLGGELLTVVGDSHTAYLSTGNRCVDRVADDYLIDLEVPAPDTVCD